jgi:hypothetical protein
MTARRAPGPSAVADRVNLKLTPRGSQDDTPPHTHDIGVAAPWYSTRGARSLGPLPLHLSPAPGDATLAHGSCMFILVGAR